MLHRWRQVIQAQQTAAWAPIGGVLTSVTAAKIHLRCHSVKTLFLHGKPKMLFLDSRNEHKRSDFKR